MPVFVDATGRRRRRVRRIAYAIGAVCLTYTGLVGASVFGHPARPDALAPLPGPADRPPPAVRQTQPPERPMTGVPFPSGTGPALEAVTVRVQARVPDEPTPSPHPSRPPAPRTESAPTTPPPATPPTPTEPPSPTEPPAPTDPPAPTRPPAPEPTDPPAPEPTEPPAPEDEPPAGLPVVGPILELLSGGSAAR